MTTHVSSLRWRSLLARRGLRRLVEVGLPDDRSRADLRARRTSQPSAPVPGRQADEGLVRDPAARRQAADAFRRGAGPHTGVHLIIVRDDLATIIHRHPPIARRRDGHATGHVPEAGPVPRRRRRLPERDGAAAELPAVRHARASPARTSRSRCRRSRATQSVDGYRFTLHGRPNLHAIQAGVPRLHRHRPAREAGAIHAVVRRARARDLLPRRARSTTSTRTSARPARRAARASLGGTQVTGSSTTPGKLNVGVLVPCAGHVAPLPAVRASDGRVLTAPFTLDGQTMNRRHRPTMKSRLVIVRARRPRGLVVAARRFGARARQPAGRRSRTRARSSRSPCRPRRRTPTTTQIELTVPDGFSIDSFVPVARLEAHGAADRLRARTR